MSCWSRESGEEEEEEEEEESEVAGDAPSTFFGRVEEGKWWRIHWRMWAWGKSWWAPDNTSPP